LIEQDEIENDSISNQVSPLLSADRGSSVKQPARFNAILATLQRTGSVSVDELSQQLHVTVVTVRRDLGELERQGRLRRTHGGAVSIEPLFYEPFRHDTSFQDMLSSFADEKRRIARAAADLVQPGETIAVSGGTTTTEVVRSLKALKGISIITNTVNVAMELSSYKDIEVVVTGGHLRGNWFSLVGPLASSAAEMLFADTMFIGVDGIDIKQGLTCTHPAEAEVLRKLVGHSKRRIVVADHSKLGAVAKWLLCPVSEINMLITDRGASDEIVAQFEMAHVQIMRV
jgi:DeoR/GlpR family transcriptional regulator of sugar metabolism